MRLAVIADVHANLAALDAVVRAIHTESPDLVVSLGDVVGYNAEPAECVDVVRRETQIAVAGNHDRDALRDDAMPGTHLVARSVQSWTRARLRAADREYLASLASIAVLPDRFVAVHGCYLNPEHVSGYVTSTMLEANLRAVASRLDWPRVALCGHTHAPMCGWLLGDECVEARGAGVRWPAGASAVLVNPGSVGQPRDGDPRAAFAVIDLRARSVAWRRVPYDVARTARAIAREGLPAALAERLREGR